MPSYNNDGLRGVLMSQPIIIICGQDSQPDPISAKLDLILERLNTMPSVNELKVGLGELENVISVESQQVKDKIEESVKAAVSEAIAPLQAKIEELSQLPATEIPQEIIDQVKSLASKVASIVEPGSPSVLPPVVEETPVVVDFASTDAAVTVEVPAGEVTNSPLPDIMP